MRVSKKPSKRAVKKLHDALKNMLRKELPDSQHETSERPTLPDITEAAKNETAINSELCRKRVKEFQESPGEERNGVFYIMSRENQLIPKLTDDQVMNLHKKADENMKRVWSDIIAKYEAVEDQGDVIDMQTGEIIEDNGHIRGISHGNNETRYKSTLRGLIDVEESGDEYEIWQDEGEEDEEAYEAEEFCNDGELDEVRGGSECSQRSNESK